MAEIQEVIKNRFTEKGYGDLKTLLKTFIGLYNEKFEYGSSPLILGFGNLNIKNEQELYSYIKLLSFLVFIPVEEETRITVMSDGTKIKIIKLVMI